MNIDHPTNAPRRGDDDNAARFADPCDAAAAADDAAGRRRRCDLARGVELRVLAARHAMFDLIEELTPDAERDDALERRASDATRAAAEAARDVAGRYARFHAADMADGTHGDTHGPAADVADAGPWPRGACGRPVFPGVRVCNERHADDGHGLVVAVLDEYAVVWCDSTPDGHCHPVVNPADTFVVSDAAPAPAAEVARLFARGPTPAAWPPPPRGDDDGGRA